MQSNGQKFLDILAALEQTEKNLIKQKRAREKSTTAYRIGFWVFWVGFVGSLALSLLLIFSVWAGAPRVLGTVSILMLLASYLVILTYPLLGAWLYRGAIKSVFQAPFASILRANLEHPMQADSAHLPQLVALPKIELQQGIMELKDARRNFAQRTALVAGPIEKIGVLPGLLAMLATLQQFDGQPEWVQAIAYANPLVFIMAVVAHHFLARYDRMIALSELALTQQEKRAKTTRQSTSSPVPA